MGRETSGSSSCSEHDEPVIDVAGERMRTELREMRAEANTLRHAAKQAADKKQRRALQDRLDVLEGLIDKRRAELEEHERVQAHIESGAAQKDAGERAAAARAARNARRRERDAAAAAEAATVAASMPDLRRLELEAIEERVLGPERLEIHDIAPNGDCMFAAVAHQLALAGHPQAPMAISALRSVAADEIERRAEHYAAFLDASDECSEGGVSAYCARIRAPGALWGGHVEMDALSAALGVCIRVFVADCPPHVFGNPSDATLRLLYRRHAYALGEHYDSLVPRS